MDNKKEITEEMKDNLEWLVYIGFCLNKEWEPNEHPKYFKLKGDYLVGNFNTINDIRFSINLEDSLYELREINLEHRYMFDGMCLIKKDHDCENIFFEFMNYITPNDHCLYEVGFIKKEIFEKDKESFINNYIGDEYNDEKYKDLDEIIKKENLKKDALKCSYFGLLYDESEEMWQETRKPLSIEFLPSKETYTYHIFMGERMNLLYTIKDIDNKVIGFVIFSGDLDDHFSNWKYLKRRLEGEDDSSNESSDNENNEPDDDESDDDNEIVVTKTDKKNVLRIVNKNMMRL